MVKSREKSEEFSAEEIEQRALDMIRRSFSLPHKTAKDFKGKTPRARARKRKAAKVLPKSP